MAGNNLIHNAEVKDKKCATCRHYEPSPLRKRGWCRNPLLYDRNTNHLVEEDTLGCSRGFGSVNYWEPLVLQTGRPALTRREKEQVRERELVAAEQLDAATATAAPTISAGEATMLGPSQAELASMSQAVDGDPRATAVIPTVSGASNGAANGNSPITRAATHLRLDTAPQVLRPAGSPAPSPNDNSRNRPRLRGGRPRNVVPATTPTPAEQAHRPIVAPPLTRAEQVKVFILARPWLPVLLGLLIILGVGGTLYVRSHDFSFKLGPLAFGSQPTPTATAAPTAIPTLILVSPPTVAPTPPSAATTPTPPLPPPTVLAIGGYATVSGASTLNVRDQASTNGAIVDKLNSGVVVHIVGGPQTAGGLDWWQVDSWPNSGGKSGWCAGKFLKPTAKP